MILESPSFKDIKFTLVPVKSIDLGEVDVLIKKIKTKQQDPFAKIYLMLHPCYFKDFIYKARQNDIKIKSMSFNDKVFLMEL
jgi:hypothetical protein